MRRFKNRPNSKMDILWLMLRIVFYSWVFITEFFLLWYVNPVRFYCVRSTWLLFVVSHERFRKSGVGILLCREDVEAGVESVTPHVEREKLYFSLSTGDTKPVSGASVPQSLRNKIREIIGLLSKIEKSILRENSKGTLLCLRFGGWKSFELDLVPLWNST